MKDQLGVSPSNGNEGTRRGKEKIHLTSVGIESTTSGLDLLLLLSDCLNWKIYCDDHSSLASITAVHI